MSPALRFRQLTVRRMPGFPGGGPRLLGLTPGINLIHGPNASGKTTAARALQSLLWPGSAPEGAGLEGRFELDGASWLVSVEAGRPSWQQDGRDSPAPPLPPAEDRDRYLLSLHGLLRADDQDLAERIRVESAGGYDVRAAAEVLGLAPGGRPNKLVDGLDAARETLTLAREREAELRDEVARLEQLRAEHRRLERTARRLEPLRRALRHARARDRLADAERAVAVFPAAMASLRGDELESVDELARQREDLVRAIATADADAARAAAELVATGLGEEGVTGAVLSEVESRLDALRRLDDELSRAEDARASARGRRQHAGAALGIDAGRDPLPGPDAAHADRLDRFVRRAGSLRERRAALEERLRLLGSAAGPPPADTDPGDVGSGEPVAAGVADRDDATREAVSALRAWLRAGGPDGPGERRVRRLLRVAIGVLALAGAGAVVATALTPGGPWLGGAGIILIALSVALLLLRPAPDTGGRAALERQVSRSGHAPPRWTADAVEGLLDGLERRLAADRANAELRREAERLHAELRDLAPAESELKAERTALSAELGLDPPPGDLALHLIATRLGEWEEARGAEAAAEALIAGIQDRRKETISAAAAALAPFGYVPADADAVAGALTDLRNRREQHGAAATNLAGARRARQSAVRDRDQVDGRRDRIFREAGLATDQEHVLREWLAGLDAFRRAASELELIRRERDAAAAALAELADRSAHRAPTAIPLPELTAGTVPELERAIDAAEQASSAERALAKTIAGIEARLADARQKHDVEDALAGVAAAEAELGDRRDRDMEAAVGAALVEWLSERDRDRNRPAVFHRARALFGLITRGRYRLDLDDADGVAFRAYDRTTHRGQALDELSSGTRLQLLLAVRVAFVETQETGAALPLLLDEVLANCDDDRAAAIIDAALALARDGRQIFYFTAQSDELVKWRSRLEAQDGDATGGVEWCVRGIPDGPSVQDGPLIDWPAAPATAVPAPDGIGHDEYGRVLRVPPFDPWADGVGGLHLWYLVEDVDALHQLLAMGVSRWGQLEYLADAAADSVLPGALRDEVIADARRAAALYDRFRQLWRQGRGRPVDRHVLAESGAVSDTFMDRVAALCEELDGDGAALVDALADGRVPRFRSAQADELRAFLVARDCLSDDDPLPPGKIRVMLLADAGTAEVDGLLDRLVGPGISDSIVTNRPGS